MRYIADLWVKPTGATCLLTVPATCFWILLFVAIVADVDRCAVASGASCSTSARECGQEG